MLYNLEMPQSSLRVKRKWTRDNWEKIKALLETLPNATIAEGLKVSHSCVAKWRNKAPRKPLPKTSKPTLQGALKEIQLASTNPRGNSKLSQALISIVEDLIETKKALRAREEQASLLASRIEELSRELLAYKASSKEKKDRNLNEVLERAQTALGLFGD